MLKKVKARDLKKVKARDMKKVKAMDNSPVPPPLKCLIGSVNLISVVWMVCVTFPTTPSLIFLWALLSGTVAEVYYRGSGDNSPS